MQGERKSARPGDAEDDRLPPEADGAIRTPDGRPLAELARESPVLVVFLRHGGCPFCREALADLQRRRTEIEATGARIALVHMMTDAEAAALFDAYGLADVPRLSDPSQSLYRAFGLRRASAWTVMGPSVWLSGARATLLGGNLPGVPSGDVFQMPGAFLIHDGRILRAYRHEASGDRPDYVDLATCPLP